MRLLLNRLTKVLAALPIVFGSGAAAASVHDTASDVDAEWKIAESMNTHAAYVTFALDHPASPMASEALQRLEKTGSGLESTSQEREVSEPAVDRQGESRLFNPNPLIQGIV